MLGPCWAYLSDNLRNFLCGRARPKGPQEVQKIGAKTQEITRFSWTWGGSFGKAQTRGNLQLLIFHLGRPTKKKNQKVDFLVTP